MRVQGQVEAQDLPLGHGGGAGGRQHLVQNARQAGLQGVQEEGRSPLPLRPVAHGPEGDVLADLLPQGLARLFTEALWRAFAFDDLHGTSGCWQGVGHQLVPAEAGGYLVPI